MEKNSKIYIAGHTGLVGSAILRKLKKEGFINIITRSHLELDLTSKIDVDNFFEKEKPEYIFLAAAKVGGIIANDTYPADFIRENILIQTNIIDAAYKNKAKKLLFLGSSCIYPKNAPQPLKEEYLLTGELEPTNKAYAIAKIAGIIMCQSYNKQYGTNFISVMPTNLYGEGDNFDLENSHVLPAMIRKFNDAKMDNSDKIILWGDGTPIRDFLYVDDLVDACVFLMNTYHEDEIINIGSGEDITISGLAEIIKKYSGFNGEIVWDISKPNGTLKKSLDISKIKSLGWQPQINLIDGIKKTIFWYKDNLKS